MLRVFRLVLICLSLFAVSCAKNQAGEAATENTDSVGYISVDGARVVELKCGFEADMSPKGWGKNNWNLFAIEQTVGNVDINKCAVSIQASESTAVLYSLYVYDIPGYGNLILELSQTGTTSFDVQGRFVEKMGADGSKHISGTAKLDDYVINALATQLDLDLVLNLDKVIRVVFHGPTPNDGLSWTFVDPEIP